MLILQSIVLAAIQGFCEFLPISSSAHLIFVPWFFNFDKFIVGQTFDISLHLGSAIAIIFCLRKEFKKLIIGFFAFIIKILKIDKNNYFEKLDDYDESYSRLSILIIIATIPIALFGVFFKDYAETIFKNTFLIGIALIIFGYILYFFDKKAEENIEIKVLKMEKLSYKNAIFIGLFQVLSIIPGVSRSGITMTSERILNMPREDAAKFSFLLATPTIIGAVILELKNIFHIISDKSQVFYFSIGFIFSIIFSYIVIKIFLNYLKKHSFKVFFIYRLIIGIIIIIISFFK
jgi:undecaprenyl-diphosphatase